MSHNFQAHRYKELYHYDPGCFLGRRWIWSQLGVSVLDQASCRNNIWWTRIQLLHILTYVYEPEHSGSHI